MGGDANLKEFTSKLHLFSIFFCSAFSKFSIGEKNKCSTEKFSSFFISFSLFFCFFVLVFLFVVFSVCQKFLKKTTRITYFKVVPSGSPHHRPCSPAPLSHCACAARCTSHVATSLLQQQHFCYLLFFSILCRQTMCNNIIDSGAGEGMIIFRK